VKGPSRTLARRYARALLDVAAATGMREAIALRDDLDRFLALVRHRSDLASALEHPGLGADAKRRVAVAITERLGASPLLGRLLVLLATNDRLALLPALAEAYAEMLNARRGVVLAQAVSAVELAGDQRQALAAALAKAAGLEVELSTRVEPEVLGGLVVRMGGTTYDGTVRARLAALRRSLAAGR
jgi:F-type H+-transporting ATPase subunit delta